MSWKEIPVYRIKNAKTSLHKGDQIWYSKNDFGFYIKKFTVQVSMEKNPTVPFGCRRNQTLIGIWDPQKFGASTDINVLIPKNKIVKVRREVKK